MYKNKKVALALCILFGYAGFHKFYECKIGTGLAYFFTAGGFCIAWIIDIFKYIGLVLKPGDTYDP
ncbi:MAG: TM2 domain-containing protein [Abditibacteriota bacterium]|nr:TM2 domain-containing protein [Abditibacteriota bacterium]